MSDVNVDYKALFQEQSLLGADFWLHLIAGVVLFCLTLLVGWLLLDYFWASMSIGIFILLYALKRMHDIFMEKNHSEKVTQEVREEAETYGFDGEVAESMIEEALNILASAAPNQQVR